MSFMVTCSGREYHLSGSGAYLPHGRPVRVHDIAHHLAQINRFTGAAIRPESVAKHSLLVSEIAQRDGASHVVQLAALMHDAHEMVTNDLSSPAKVALNATRGEDFGYQPWRTFEGEHAKHFRARLGLTTVFVTTRQRLHRYDLQALATERRDLLTWTPDTNAPWPVLRDEEADRIDPIDWIRLDTPERASMTWEDWRDRFIDRVDELTYVLGHEVGDR